VFIAATHEVHQEPGNDDESRWMTAGVKIDLLGGQAKIAGVPAAGRMKIQFGRASQAVIVCNGRMQSSFVDLDSVKALMRKLVCRGEWDRELCIITHVCAVSSALILFSTDKNQVAELKATASLSGLPDPLAALQIPAKVGLVASSKNQRFGGFSRPCRRAARRSLWPFASRESGFGVYGKTALPS